MQEFTVSVENDGGGEDNEKFGMELRINSSSRSDVTVGDGTATVWIIEDDADTVDLQLTRNAPPSNVSKGDTLTYEYTVENRGPGGAINVKLVSTLDPKVSVSRPDLPTECSHSGQAEGGDVDCALGNIPSGQTRSVSVKVDVTSAPEGGIVNRARVFSSSADPSPRRQCLSAGCWERRRRRRRGWRQRSCSCQRRALVS